MTLFNVNVNPPREHVIKDTEEKQKQWTLLLRLYRQGVCSHCRPESGANYSQQIKKFDVKMANRQIKHILYSNNILLWFIICTVHSGLFWGEHDNLDKPFRTLTLALM